MTMTRQHFALIAEVINKLDGEFGPIAGSHLTPQMKEGIARSFCGALARTNPNFNRTRFLRACGVED